MGDRTYLRVRFFGSIATVAAIDALLEAIDYEGLSPYHDKDETAEFLEAMSGDEECAFHDHECNYAEIERVEEVCREHNIGFAINHAEGGEYGAAFKAFYPGDGTYTSPSDGDCASITRQALEDALKSDEALMAARDLLDAAKKSEGIDTPPLTLSEEVVVYLKNLESTQK